MLLRLMSVSSREMRPLARSNPSSRAFLTAAACMSFVRVLAKWPVALATSSFGGRAGDVLMKFSASWGYVRELVPCSWCASR